MGDRWLSFRLDMIKLRATVAEFLECADGHRGRECGKEEEAMAVVLKDADKQVSGKKSDPKFSEYRLKNGKPFTRIEDVCDDPVIEMQNGGNDLRVFYPARLAAYEACLKGINSLIFAPNKKK